jgi:hypothetical protein
VELKHIGLFFKRKGDSLYTFVPNDDLLNDARLRLVDINTENTPALPAEIADAYDGKPLPLNFHTIASICDCKPDLVTTFLNRFR